MKDVVNFFNGMSSGYQGIFTQIINDMSEDCTPQELSNIENELEKVKKEKEKFDKRHQILTNEFNNLEVISEKIEDFLKTNDSLLMFLLKHVLWTKQNAVKDEDVQYVQSNLNRLKKKELDLTRRKRRLSQQGYIADVISEGIMSASQENVEKKTKTKIEKKTEEKIENKEPVAVAS